MIIFSGNSVSEIMLAYLLYDVIGIIVVLIVIFGYVVITQKK